MITNQILSSKVIYLSADKLVIMKRRFDWLSEGNGGKHVGYNISLQTRHFDVLISLESTVWRHTKTLNTKRIKSHTRWRHSYGTRSVSTQSVR